MQRTSLSFKFGFGAFENAEGSRLGFGILILIHIWSLVFGISPVQILALYLNFEGAKTSMSFNFSFGALEDAGGT